MTTKLYLTHQRELNYNTLTYSQRVTLGNALKRQLVRYVKSCRSGHVLHFDHPTKWTFQIYGINYTTASRGLQKFIQAHDPYAVAHGYSVAA